MRSIDELASEICTLSGHINAANHRWLLLVAEYDRRNGWSDGATQSCAHWLNWRCGIAMGAAREKVRVARALETLPKISAAMASGSLSYSKVREITRIASAETEDYLLMIAEHGTAAPRGEDGARVSPLPGGRGAVARGTAAAVAARELSLR